MDFVQSSQYCVHLFGVIWGREVTNMRMIFNLAIATITFLTFFYSATVALSLMYALDSAFLRF